LYFFTPQSSFFFEKPSVPYLSDFTYAPSNTKRFSWLRARLTHLLKPPRHQPTFRASLIPAFILFFFFLRSLFQVPLFFCPKVLPLPCLRLSPFLTVFYDRAYKTAYWVSSPGSTPPLLLLFLPLRWRTFAMFFPHPCGGERDFETWFISCFTQGFFFFLPFRLLVLFSASHSTALRPYFVLPVLFVQSSPSSFLPNPCLLRSCFLISSLSKSRG